MPLAAKLLVMVGLVASLGAKHVSTNFVVEASSKELAQRVAQAAEQQREQLAIAWFGHTLDPWGERCKVTVQDGPKLGAGGKTKFKFEQGEVYGWDMFVQGSVERIIDSVIPHEVNHTILACYFRRPVPRWADEGAASLFEHDSEIKKQQDLANQLVQGGRRIPLRVLLDMKEYPTDMQQTLALYAEGYSLTNFLVQTKGRSAFLRFLNDAQHQAWDAALRTFYGKQNIETLEREWTSWVLAGSPRLSVPDGQLVAKQEASRTPKLAANSQVRAQSPTPDGATALQQLRQRAKEKPDQPLPRVEELAAPNPRGTAPRAVAPKASELKALPLFARQPSEELRPIELIRIDDRANEKTVTPKFEGAAEPQPSAQRLYRETRLRSEQPPTAKPDKLAPFGQFPSRVK